MAASYPTSAKSFTTKNTSDTIQAAHVNDVQDEITAIENDLLGPFPVARGGTGLTAIGASGTVLSSDGSVASWAVPVNSKPCNGRLSLTTGVAVTTADVTAATTLYWVPYQGNQVALYTGSAWTLVSQAQLSIAVPATTATMYDVFLDYNAGTPALALTAWTNDTTRATALTTQDGVLVQTGNLDWRYVGSFRTTGVSGQTEDSNTKRYVWNYYHRVQRSLLVKDATASWTYTTATWRQARATATNQVEIVVGVAEVPLDILLTGVVSNTNASVAVQVGIGEDSTSTAINTGVGGGGMSNVAGAIVPLQPFRLVKYPAIGRHYYAWLEISTATGTTTWYGGQGFTAATDLSGITGSIQG